MSLRKSPELTPRLLAATLAPAGEAWTQMARQQAALDRSIDRTVRILIARRKEFLKLHLPPPSTDPVDDAEMEEINKILGIDIPQETTEKSKTERTKRECR